LYSGSRGFSRDGGLLGFAVGAVAAAVAAVLGEFQAVRVVLLVLLGVVVAALALLASEDNHDPVFFFGHLLVLMGDPT
jgi:hypothetical protein